MKLTPEGELLYDQYLRHSLSGFTEMAFKVLNPTTAYKHNWHLDAITEYLMAVYNGDIKRLIVNMPPRSLKTISITDAFPAWCLGHDPSLKFITSSYAQDIALKNNVDTRAILESDDYKRVFPGTIIADDQNEKKKFMTTKRGQILATSTGSRVTGEGADYIIVDDPLNPTQAASTLERQSANEYFRQTLISRLNDKSEGRIIVVMQRLHVEDLSGVLLETGMWEHLCLPAIEYQERTISIGGFTKERKPGDLLHEDREGKQTLETMRLEMGDTAFAGQYLQHPAPIEGAEFKDYWLQWYEKGALNYSECNLYILVDPAHEKKKESDWTAMVVVALAPDNNYYIVDIVRDKLNPTESVQKLIALHKKWNQEAGKPPIVGYERYGMQSDIHYIKEEQRKIGYRFSLTELGGALGNQSRIRRLIPLFETQRIYLPYNLMYVDYTNKPVDLIKTFVNRELLTFPAVHCDMVDAFSRILDGNLHATHPRLQSNSQAAARKPVKSKQAWVSF